MYFLDKYATVMVGGARSMTKYYKNYNGNTLLDRLTTSDIAYSVLVYESAHDMRKKVILKSETCHTIQEKKEFQRTESLNIMSSEEQRLCCSRTDGPRRQSLF